MSTGNGKERKAVRWARDLTIVVTIAVVATVGLVFLDAFDVLHEITRAHEGWNLDEIILGSGVLALASLWFAWRRWRESGKFLGQRFEAERDLRKSNDELSFLVSAAPGVFYTCEPDGDFAATFVSPGIEALQGYDPEDFTSDPGFWADRIHPDDRERVFAEIGPLFEEGRHAHEYRFRHADGSYNWMHDQLALFRDADGKPERIAGFWHDITERKAFEQRLTAAVEERTAELSRLNRALEEEIGERRRIEATTVRLARIVEDSINEVYVFEAESLKFMEVNSAACTNLGYTREELEELTPVDLKPEFTRENFEDLIAPLRSGVSSHVRFETRHRRKDGSLYDVHVTLQQIRSEDRPVFVAIIEDTTDRKLAEEQLHQAQKMEAVGQLTGGIAHDFNNVLAAITGNLELLGDRLEGDAKARQALDAGMRAASRAADLTARLLAFSRRQRLEPEAIDLGGTLSGMRGLLQTTLTESIDLDVLLAGDLRPVWADPAQLESAILNLAINARDAMPRGGQFLIETANTDLDESYAARHPDVVPGAYVELVASDTGHGMSPEVRERIFEPFFTTKEFGKGSGLGLSMVFGYIKQLGGHVSVYSEAGIGTSVKLYLPVADAGYAASPEARPSGDDCPGGAETVLVVEDDPDVREITMVILEGLGYRVLLAENGPAALLRLEEQRDVDLLFTDMVMPEGMSGLDLAREASGRQPGLRVLCTSGYSEQALARDGSSGLGVEWLGKPYRREDLARKVRQVLDRPPA